jgi:hypothetical protein
MFWIIILSFAVLMGLAYIIYKLPADPAVRSKKKKEKPKRPSTVPEAKSEDDGKDWKSIAERWEKNNQALLAEIEKLKTGHKAALQSVEEQKSQYGRLSEKFELEKTWREKEQETLEKSKRHEKDLKDQIFRTENDLEKEHSNRLRMEREAQELRIKYDQALEEQRQMAVKAGSLQTTVESNVREIRELKGENARLKEKREDVQWVTKTEFDQLKKAFAAKEQELARLKEK